MTVGDHTVILDYIIREIGRETSTSITIDDGMLRSAATEKALTLEFVRGGPYIPDVCKVLLSPSSIDAIPRITLR
jgi:hypothetical protein